MVNVASTQNFRILMQMTQLGFFVFKHRNSSIHTCNVLLLVQKKKFNFYVPHGLEVPLHDESDGYPTVLVSAVIQLIDYNVDTIFEGKRRKI